MPFLPTLRTLRTAIHPAGRSSDRKVVGANVFEVLSAAGAAGTHYRPWPIDRAVAEALERSVWVFKSVQAIAGHQSRLSYGLKDGEDVVDDHPMMRLLNKKANPIETGPQLRKRLGAQLLLSRRGVFVEVTKSRSGTPIRLDLLPPGRTRPVPAKPYDMYDLRGQDLSALRNIIDYFEVERTSGSPRRISPEKVRWLRDPHPIDPLLGMTPLEAAGMSVQLDIFARMYNIRMMANDGRPGGVVAIEGDMEDDDMAELERRFAPGPLEAGKTTVVTGKVSYVDVGSKPRDMAHETTSRTAKEEVLVAFGVGESVIGNAAGRTFDNAEQEEHNFWTVTMLPFLDLITTGFDEDSEDNVTGFFDTSGVEALQRAERLRREESRTEVEAGLRSIDEYREVAGLPRLETPQSRALWIAGGKTPVPASEEDAEAFGLSPAGEEEAPAEEGQEEAPAELEPAPEEGGGQEQARPRGGAGGPGGEPDELFAGIKALPPPPPDEPGTEETEEGWTSEPDGAAAARLEEMLAAALASTAARLLGRTLARLTSPKTRKHTRHWQIKAVAEDTRSGDQALDATRAVDAERWSQDAQEAAAPIVTAAAVAAAAALLADLGASTTASLSAVVAKPVADVLALIGASAAGQAARLADYIARLDQDGLDGAELDLQAIITAAGGQSGRLTGWAALLAVQVATATLNGARDEAVIHITAEDPHADIVRTWWTRQDHRVRPTHRHAAGQTQGLQELFVVGGALLRYPGDPLGPPAEVVNCRCFLMHWRRSTGQFVPAPAGTSTRRAG